MIYGILMELGVSKGISSGVMFGKSAKVLFGLPKGHLAGGDASHHVLITQTQ